jgi:hypothetical protein
MLNIPMKQYLQRLFRRRVYRLKAMHRQTPHHSVGEAVPCDAPAIRRRITLAEAHAPPSSLSNRDARRLLRAHYGIRTIYMPRAGS